MNNLEELEKILGIDIDKIIRSKRKTIGLQITERGELIIRIPIGTKEKTIIKIVEKHKRWINKKKGEINLRNIKFIPKKFIEGENYLFLGKNYPLRISKKQKEDMVFDSGYFFVNKNVSDCKKIFMNWYKEEGLKIIGERVNYFAIKGGFNYNNIRITSANKRWGSCSFKGNLNFSWRLIMAPLPIVDYVVVHELSHTMEKNHGKKFWRIVSSIIPDFKERERWLKKNGYLLRL
jgi:predicted metal-dependent hydrolase